jgi:putative flippase GtrA
VLAQQRARLGPWRIQYPDQWQKMTMAKIGLPAHKFIRFLVSGALNTLLTFGIYFALETVINYQVAYLIAYAAGIVFSYYLNTKFVFNTKTSLRTFIRFPLVYIFQYIFGALLLELLVKKLGAPSAYAPLAVTAITLPMTYFLSKIALLK